MNNCYIHPETGVTHCAEPSACPPGAGWDSRTLACVAAPNDSAPVILGCRVTVLYPANAPHLPIVEISGRPSGCDSAGVELALAVILARLLGAK